MDANALAIPNRFNRVALGITNRGGEMIKGSQLVGRAVIDMEAAERLGKIKEIIVQRDGERVAGFVVVHGETIVRNWRKAADDSRFRCVCDRARCNDCAWICDARTG